MCPSLFSSTMSSCKAHNVRFYDLEPRAIHCMAFEPQHRKLALSRSDHSVEVWDISSTPHMECWIPNLKDVSVEALGWCNTRLFSTGLQGFVVEYDLSSLMKKYEVPVTSGPAWCLDVSRDHSHLAVGTEDGYINIFKVTEDGLEFVKILDRQEGRVLCLAWDASGEAIVTGSIDTVRIWNVHKGHAVHRMTTGRNERNRETIVWCLAVTDDFTIISGDSRGKLSFWNGQMGTLIESFPTHLADILCLSVSDDQKSVYCSGVDPLIVCFACVQVRVANGERSRWVKSVQRRVHEHDVRALACADARLFSGGVDGYLALSYPPKILFKYPPILQGPCAVVCRQARCLFLRYVSRLEVWKLAEISDIPQPVKLLTLYSRGGEPIVCASLSGNSKWLAYSTPTTTCFFTFTMDAEEPCVKKIHGIPPECGPSHHILFTMDSSYAVIATSTGNILILQMEEHEPVLIHNLHPIEDKLLRSRIHLMEISTDGNYLVAADHQSRIGVWNMKDGKVHCLLPQYRYAPTAMGIHPETNYLVVTYADHKLIEYDIPHRQYTKFSRKIEARHPKQWLSKGFAVSNITFDYRSTEVILLQDDSNIYVINKNKELPTVEAKIPRLDMSHSDSMDSFQSHPRTADPPHAFHVIKKYKHLIYLEWLVDDELLAVELCPSFLAERLPPILKKKRFGI
ncbi:U3 small nucleolar RNA-associated protein 4 homolog [Anabrus simplex]|uniref:U3 small nucleolar RNA-associated protein 4 homolog n=1 Tax=Anabrus simplex TaxID=316456 RepID=UPI0034DDA6B7